MVGRKDKPQTGSRVLLDGRQDWTEPNRVQAVYAECLRLVRRAGSFAVDLRDVRVMDSKLIACLIAIQREATRRGAKVTVLASDAATKWMDTCMVRQFMVT